MSARDADGAMMLAAESSPVVAVELEMADAVELADEHAAVVQACCDAPVQSLPP
jgi:hypothetical protein